MATKRGTSDYSLLVGINKPKGMSSHDAVNRVRTIFGERRVGHMGTLDPLATGVLPVCIGPATRLDAFMVGHDKTYIAEVKFGAETNTADSEGEVVATGEPISMFYDQTFADSYVASLVGEHDQQPPAFSAIKVNGQVAYKMARAGAEVDLPTRRIEIYAADLLDVDESEEDGALCWRIRLSVSKGTYIRSIAQDIGRDLGCPTHLSGLERVQVGSIALDDCVSIETLENLKDRAALDPIRALGFRYAFIDDAVKVANGAFFRSSDISLYQPLKRDFRATACGCTSQAVLSDVEPVDGENVCFIVDNKLAAIYSFDARARMFKPSCVFNKGVIRG